MSEGYGTQGGTPFEEQPTQVGGAPAPPGQQPPQQGRPGEQPPQGGGASNAAIAT